MTFSDSEGHFNFTKLSKIVAQKMQVPIFCSIRLQTTHYRLQVTRW